MSNSSPTCRETLILSCLAGTVFRYTFFWGHRKGKDASISKSCFSQWFDSPFSIDGEIFPTAEHYMMVRKARLFGDEATARAILNATSPNEAKSLGRKVHGFSEAIWLEHREEIVFTGNLAKFQQSGKLKKFLLSTGDDILVEASPVDPIWGIGLAQEDSRASSPSEWPGLNLLGFALVKVRGRCIDS